MEDQAKATQTSNKGLKIITILACIAAVCGVSFGAYGMIQSSQKSNQISDFKVQIKDSDGETTTTVEATDVETTPSDGTIVTITDCPTISADELSDYIYVAQWGIKIALPKSLRGVSYSYETNPGYTSLYVNGTSCADQERCQYVPEFANPGLNQSLGVVSRYHKDADTSSLYGMSKVFSIDDYDYYYSGPQATYSTDSDEQAWELESVNLIKEALTNASNYSAI